MAQHPTNPDPSEMTTAELFAALQARLDAGDRLAADLAAVLKQTAVPDPVLLQAILDRFWQAQPDVGGDPR